MERKRLARRKRRYIRSVQWRILLYQVPLILSLLAGVLYWLEGHLNQILAETRHYYGLQSLSLLTSAVRHSMPITTAPPSWDRMDELLPAKDTLFEVVSLNSRVVYASDPALRGRTYRRFTDFPCSSCHIAGSPRPEADMRIISEPGVGSFQIFTMELRNGKECRGCHRNDGPRLGMVYSRQSLSPVHRLIRTGRMSLLLTSVFGIAITILGTRVLLGRYLSRPGIPSSGRLPRAAGPAGAFLEPHPPTSTANPSEEAAERLRESLKQIKQQRDELSTLYFITDQLSRSAQPGMVCRRAVELATSVFGSVCVLIAGRFHPESHAFSGTVTYHGPTGEIVERPYPDEGVKQAALYYHPAIVERWLRGELDGVARIREETTVGYPLERHGRRLGLLLAPDRGRQESPDGRPTAANPEVEQVARKHLAIALEMSELQREMLQEERLAAIGQTVAGLSHCIKNTLNGLKGGKFIIERALSINNSEKLHKGLGVLTSSIQHIERITHDMLFYAADRSLAFEEANPNDTMREIAELLEEQGRSKGVEIRADLDPLMTPIPIDRHALYRAILNLVTNAVDACVEAENGNTVTLRSRSEPACVVLSVEDNGVGIPEDILHRITERFFTTKSSQGTGLGLPVVQKIAEQHRGTLEVESVVGRGSVFHLRLPRAAGQSQRDGMA
jgi:signal transduction histidine kinase